MLIRHLVRKDFEVGKRRGSRTMARTPRRATGLYDGNSRWLQHGVSEEHARFASRSRHCSAWPVVARNIVRTGLGGHGGKSNRQTKLRVFRASMARGLESRIPNPAWGTRALGHRLALSASDRGDGVEIVGSATSIPRGVPGGVSLLLAVILLGIGTGSLAGGFVNRWISKPAHCLIVVQGLFVVSTLLGLPIASARQISEAVSAYAAHQGQPGIFVELWFNAKPILLVVGSRAAHGLPFRLDNAVSSARKPRRSSSRRLVYANNVGPGGSCQRFLCCRNRSRGGTVSHEGRSPHALYRGCASKPWAKA